MRLIRYSYKLIDCPGWDNWILNEIELQNFNLIVGKNATGKSRALIVVSAFANMITQTNPVYIGNWEFTFVNDNEDEIYYNIIKFSKSIEEKIVVNNKLLLERHDDTAKLFSQIKNDFDIISPPDKKLVLHVRRDKKEYPFLEDIVEWAEKTHSFKFGQIHPNSFIGNDKDEKKYKTIEDVPSLIDKISDSSKRKVLDEINSIGYEIENIYAEKESGEDILYVKQRKMKYAFRQTLLSQGMLRAVSLIVFIHYLIDKNAADTIIVDDICEGLDYERATKLGSLIFEKFQDSGVQFIVSSNDSFLMDVINIRCWNILVREDNHIKAYNYKNSKDKFDNFKYSGLSNFDLFSSDYLD